MEMAEILNRLIQKVNANNYLEIGVASGRTFAKIKCKNKIGVDPGLSSQATFIGSSDEFFVSNDMVFYVICVDGLHHSDQVYRDIKNSLAWLSADGYIVCHDLLPPSEEYTAIPPVQNLWTGDCYKAWIKLRAEEPNLSMCVIDTDFGCGLICRGKQELITVPKQITWVDFVKNKQHWMNIISVNEFTEMFLAGNT